MDNKKGDGMMQSATAYMLLAILVIFVGYYLIEGRVQAAGRTISPFEVKAYDESCKIRGQGLFDSGPIKETIEGANGDKFPDDCDMCLGGDNNKKESNSVGIADACYVESTSGQKIKTYREMCKARGGCFISDTNQCCIGDAISKCGSKCK